MGCRVLSSIRDGANAVDNLSRKSSRLSQTFTCFGGESNTDILPAPSEIKWDNLTKHTNLGLQCFNNEHSKDWRRVIDWTIEVWVRKFTVVNSEINQWVDGSFCAEQVWSNQMFHRGLPSDKEEQLTLANFQMSERDAASLLHERHPPRYKTFMLEEYFRAGVKRKLNGTLIRIRDFQAFKSQ